MDSKKHNFKLMEEKMTYKNCKFYESCSAPLCPMSLDKQNTNCIWYPDEEICRKIKGLPSWVRQQRKIAKKAKPENCWRYFTIDMLKVRFRVTSSVKGLDPSVDLEKEGLQLKTWRNKHKGTSKIKLSEEQLNKKRSAAAEARMAKERKQKTRVEETAQTMGICPFNKDLEVTVTHERN
jgi:hypothetical protein